MSISLPQQFKQASTPTTIRRQKKRSPPFSLRLTQDERVRLEADAGRQPLGGYIKSRLFDGAPPKRRRKTAPVYDDKQIAMVLAVLHAAHPRHESRGILRHVGNLHLRACPKPKLAIMPET